MHYVVIRFLFICIISEDMRYMSQQEKCNPEKRGKRICKDNYKKSPVMPNNPSMA